MRRKRLEIYYVRVGDNIMEVADPGEQELPIHKIDFHDNFNVGPYLNNDIALVHISKGDCKQQVEHIDFIGFTFLKEFYR
jgi:hypothetical protein